MAACITNLHSFAGYCGTPNSVAWCWQAGKRKPEVVIDTPNMCRGQNNPGCSSLEGRQALLIVQCAAPRGSNAKTEGMLDGRNASVTVFVSAGTWTCTAKPLARACRMRLTIELELQAS